MTPESFEEAKQMWRLFYALQSFRHCKAAAEHISEGQLEAKDPVFYPLVTAVYVLYSKPFKKAWGGIGCLSDAIVPPANLELHKNLLDSRDQIYAHRDATPSALPNPGGVSQIRFLVLPEETRLFGTDFHARHPYMPHVIALCGALEEAAQRQINELANKHLSELPKEVGEYMVNIHDENGGFFIKADPLVLRRGPGNRS